MFKLCQFPSNKSDAERSKFASPENAQDYLAPKHRESRPADNSPDTSPCKTKTPKSKLALKTESKLNIIYAPLIFSVFYMLVIREEVKKTHKCASRPPFNLRAHLSNIYFVGILVFLKLRKPRIHRRCKPNRKHRIDR